MDIGHPEKTHISTMQISLDIDTTRYTIRAYAPGTVTITVPKGQELQSPQAIPAIGPEAARTRQEILTRSAIIAPDGSYLAGPVYDEETILYGEIDLEKVILGKQALDVGGHYGRPDVVRLVFDPTPHPPLVTAPLIAPDGVARAGERPASRPATRKASTRRPSSA